MDDNIVNKNRGVIMNNILIRRKKEMKKVLAVVLAVVMFMGIVGTVHAENPTDNPFAVQPIVTKVMSLDKTIPVALKNGNSIFKGPNNTVWIVTQGGGNSHILQVDNTGKIIKDVTLQGTISINGCYIYNVDNYLYIGTFQEVGNNTFNCFLNCFDLQKGEVIWNKSWSNVKTFGIALTLSGLICATDKNFAYVDDMGKTIFTLDFTCEYFASNSKNNSIFVLQRDKDKVLEVSLADGKVLNTYDFPVVMEMENNTSFVWYSAIKSNKVLDLNKTNMIPSIFIVGDWHSPYSDRLFVADVYFDGNKFTVENKVTYTPNKADGEFFGWDAVLPASVPFNYILQDVDNYRIFMDSPYHHLSKQNIEVHDKKNNLLWSKVTNSTKKIYNLNASIIYKDMIVYGDEEKIVFANLSDGTIRYSIALDEPTEDSLFCPIGAVGNDFWFGLSTLSGLKTSLYKITFPGTITVNSNMPSAGFTITSGSNSLKGTVGKAIELPMGTYTITMDASTIDGVKAPDPVQTTIADNSDKTIDLNYIDTKAPDVSIDNPVVNENTATVNGTVSDNFSGVKEVDINGTAVTISDGKFTVNLPVTNGILSFTINATDNDGNTVSKSFKYDYLPPEISFTVSDPVIDKSNNTATFIVSGSATDNDSVDALTINGFTVTLNDNGKFSTNVNAPYSSGSAFTITVIATDKSGNKTTKTYNYTFKKITEIVLKIGSSSFIVNGAFNILDSPPIIKNARTLVPIRPVIESLDGSVSWDGTQNKVTVSLGSSTVELWIGKSIAKVNGVDTLIDSSNSKVVPEIINGRTMLPLRFVTESLGCDVKWDANTQTITITYGG